MTVDIPAEELGKRAIAAAYMAASEVFLNLDGNLDGDEHLWPQLGGDIEDLDHDHQAVTLETLADFVRREPAVPAEALYRFAAGQSIHEGAPDGWAGLSLGRRGAYAVFRDTLVSVDAMIAASQALAASQNPQIPPAAFHPVDEDDTIFAQGTTPFDMVGKLLDERDRPMRIIPGTGTPPGHAAMALPTPPPIGPDNTVSPHLSIAGEGAPAEGGASGAIGQDLAAQEAAKGLNQPDPAAVGVPGVAGAPAHAGGIAPGGAVPLGHGFEKPEEAASPEGVESEGGARNAPERGGVPEPEPRSPQNPDVPAPGESRGEPPLPGAIGGATVDPPDTSAILPPATADEAIARMRQDGDADPEGTARLNFPALFPPAPPPADPLADVKAPKRKRVKHT